MSYDSHFQLADEIVAHLTPIVSGITDPFISSRYVGFVAVSSVTVYELAIKEIFITFATKKNKILGTFTESFFERINGRIKIRDLRDSYITRFGDKYLSRFTKALEIVEQSSLKTHGVSICSRYGNLITCRHEFAHEGKISTNMTFNEIVESYNSGKEVIHCLARCMRM